MKDKVNSDADSRLQSRSNSYEDDTNSQFVVVKLEDEDPEMDLSIFAPVESSDCEEDEDELSDSSGDSSWRRNIQERDDQDSVSPPKHSPRRSLKAQNKSRQTFLAEQRRKLETNLDCSAADRDMSVDVPSEEHTFGQAAPPSDSARGPVEISGLDTAISPLAAMEPPVFPNAPVQSTSVVGEDQQNLLLEVLNHCRFLHAAVQRLEEKIDRQMSNESSTAQSTARRKKTPKRQVAEDEHLSWALAQRLGPPVHRNSRWDPPWRRAADGADLQQAGNPSGGVQTGRTGRGRGRGRGRGQRGRGGSSRSHQHTPENTPLVTNKHSAGQMCTDHTLPSQKLKQDSWAHTEFEHQQKRKKSSAHVHGEKEESDPKHEEATVQDNNKVMIGSSLRKVWIPQCVYKEVFKETEPQKAVASVLYSLFPISTLSCSAVTGNPAKGIQQLDPNKIEALREFLAEMFPQFDVSVRGVAWAQCLGMINNITKNLKKTAGKT